MDVDMDMDGDIDMAALEDNHFAARCRRGQAPPCPRQW